MRLGLSSVVAFLVLRAINIYGDPLRWSTQKLATFTVLSFLNTTKNPPSLLYLLMTLGPAPLFLWAIDGKNAAMVAARAHRGQSAAVLLPSAHTSDIPARGRGVLCTLREGAGVRGTVLLLSAARMGILFVDDLSGVGLRRACAFPLCRWFADLKQRRSDAWLS